MPMQLSNTNVKSTVDVVVFQLQSLTIPPPMNGSSADGVCGTMKQNITIVYSGFDLNVTFNFIMNNNSMYHMDSFQLTARNGKLNDSGWFRSFFNPFSPTLF